MEAGGEGDVHWQIMSEYLDYYRSQGFYCIIDPGGRFKGKMPDILIYQSRMTYREDGKAVIDFEGWSPRIIAIEVEVYPEKHPERVYQNYVKCVERGLDLIFVVQSQEEKRKVYEILRSNGVERPEEKVRVQVYEPIKGMIKEIKVSKNAERIDEKLYVLP